MKISQIPFEIIQQLKEREIYVYRDTIDGFWRKKPQTPDDDLCIFISRGYFGSHCYNKPKYNTCT